MAKLEYVIVDTQHANPYLYCFAYGDIQALEMLQQAREQRKVDAERFAKLLSMEPDNVSFQAYYEDSVNAKFEIMTFAEYQALQREYFLSRPIEEVSEARFYEAFECLPPLHIRHLDELKGNWYFSMSEFYTGTFTGQYAKIDGRYYYALVDITDRATYIYNRLEEER